MPEARQNNSKLAEMLARASNFRALVGMAVDVVGLFMALLSFVESAPRAYRLKASNAAPPFSTSAGTSAFYTARTHSGHGRLRIAAVQTDPETHFASRKFLM